MRRDLSKGTVQWAVRVAEDHFQQLSAQLPISGAKTWLVVAGLSKFLDMMDANADYRAWAHVDIQQHLYNEEKRNLHSVVVHIPIELYERFNRLFPEFGATSWFTRRIISFFLIEASEIVLDEILDRSVSHFGQSLSAADSHV